jgi:hypothetical protein
MDMVPLMAPNQEGQGMRDRARRLLITSILSLPVAWLVLVLALCWLNVSARLVLAVGIIAAAGLYAGTLLLTITPCIKCGRQSSLATILGSSGTCLTCTSQRPWHRAMIAVGTILGGSVVIAASIAVVGICLLVRWILTGPPIDVVGNANGASQTCQLKDLRAFPNHQGDVAVLREANCPGALAQGSAYFVVFVHKGHEPNARQNIAFQFEPGFQGQLMSPAPTVVWTGDSSLEITELGVIEEVVIQRECVEGTRVKYLVGRVQARDARPTPCNSP